MVGCMCEYGCMVLSLAVGLCMYLFLCVYLSLSDCLAQCLHVCLCIALCLLPFLVISSLSCWISLSNPLRNGVLSNTTAVSAEIDRQTGTDKQTSRHIDG